MNAFARLAGGVAIATSLALVSIPLAQAQESDTYPDAPVTMIIPYPPGGGTDILGRIVANKLSEIWGQPVVVENRPGASGLIGAKTAMQADADGHTLVVGSTGTIMSVAEDAGVTSSDTFTLADSLAPVTMIAAPPYVVAINPQVEADSVKELIALAKENPGKISYSSSGVGSASHLTGELFADMAGVELLHIPYKGTGQAVADLLSGEVSMMFGPAPTLLPHIESGALKVLAVTPPERSGLFPDYPTVAESGVPGFESVGWFGIFAPKDTPEEIVAEVNEAAREALGSEDVRKQLADQGAEPMPMSAAEFGEFVNRDTMKWIKLKEAAK